MNQNMRVKIAYMKGFNCWVLSSNKDALKHVGLRPDRKIKVFNGDLECSFRKYSIYEGSKKGKYMNQDGESAKPVESTSEPEEEFQGKEHPKEDWVKATIEKKRSEKRSFDKKPFEKKNFEKKPYERRNEEARQGGSKPKRDRKYDRSDDKRSERKPRFEDNKHRPERTESQRGSVKSSDKYATESKEAPITKPDSKEETKGKKVIIEPVVEKRPPSNKYAKKEEVSSDEKPKAEPKVEKPQIDLSEKKSETDSKETKPASSTKKVSAKDKYGKK